MRFGRNWQHLRILQVDAVQLVAAKLPLSSSQLKQTNQNCLMTTRRRRRRRRRTRRRRRRRSRGTTTTGTRRKRTRPTTAFFISYYQMHLDMGHTVRSHYDHMVLQTRCTATTSTPSLTSPPLSILSSTNQESANLQAEL